MRISKEDEIIFDQGIRVKIVELLIFFIEGSFTFSFLTPILQSIKSLVLCIDQIYQSINIY